MGQNYGSRYARGFRSQEVRWYQQVRAALYAFRPDSALDVDNLRLSRLVNAVLAGMLLALCAAYKLSASAAIGSIPPDVVVWPGVLLAAAQVSVLAASYRSTRVRHHFRTIVEACCYLTAGWFVVLAAESGFHPQYAVGLLFVIPAVGVGCGVISKKAVSLASYFSVLVTAAAVAAYLTAAPGTGPVLLIVALLCTSLLTTFVVVGWLAARSRYLAYEEQYRAVIEQASDGVYLFDADTDTILDANAAFCRMTGLTVPQLRTTTVHELLLPMTTADRERRSDRVERSPAGSAIGHVSNRLLRQADGTLVPVELQTDRISHKRRKILSVVVHDVQSSNEYEERLLRAKESADEIASFKSSLLANMSHEIRTPLCSILGWAAVLTDELPDRQRELVGLIEKSGQRLHNTLDSVIELAQLHANSKTIRPALVDVNDVVESTVTNLSSLVESKGLQLELNCADEEIWSELDPSCLHRIIVHIVDNAVKFTDRGIVSVTIDRREDEAAVVIADTGDGISDQFLPSIFEEFRQGSEGLARDHEGNGLGLAIARRLVELIGGRIDVVSERGVGSTFTVFVPALRQPSVAEMTYRERTVARTG